MRSGLQPINNIQNMITDLSKKTRFSSVLVTAIFLITILAILLLVNSRLAKADNPPIVFQDCQKGSVDCPSGTRTPTPSASCFWDGGFICDGRAGWGCGVEVNPVPTNGECVPTSVVSACSLLQQAYWGNKCSTYCRIVPFVSCYCVYGPATTTFDSTTILDCNK